MRDNYSYFEKRDREQADWEERLPVCEHCEQPIMDEYCYPLGDEYYCPSCMDKLFKKPTSDYMQE